MQITEHYTVGVDLGGTNVKIGVLGRAVEPIFRTSIPFEPGDPEAMLLKIAEQIEACRQRYPVTRVGVAAAGSVDTRTGRVWGSNIAFDGVPVRDVLSERLHLPVWVDNDAQAALQAEWSCGACKGKDHVVFLCFGTGIGGALILNGQPYRGRSNGGAELGHIVTHFGGEMCTCGTRGCYEAYASATALAQMANCDPREAFDRAKQGDRTMLRVIDSYADEVAAGIVSLMAVFEPEVVVLGGGISGAGRFFLDRVLEAVERTGTWTYDPEQVLITLARHKNDAGIIGAASLAEYYIEFAE